ncbi:MAG: sec-independent protein translocase TatC [Flavobacteriales bacterium]|nr:sec-independent protein translocase TatC [Flavobacteriales bacterium]|tara:strand:+ start:19 stop:399 length:381 start_codon:yes stop_codon:yes gene_type:complete
MKDIENREDLELLIDRFYKKALKDEVIQHFFTKEVELNWDSHIPLIVDFWESSLLGTGIYRGNPMSAHIALDQNSPMEQKHFDRWLNLWEESVKEHFAGEKADLAVSRAKQIAQLMQFKIGQERKH